MAYPMQPGAALAITQRSESDPAGPSPAVVPALPLAGADRPGEGPDRAQVAATARSLLDDQLLDEMVARMRADGARLTGPGGVLTEIIKAVLERGLAAELTSHLGYDKHDPAGNGSGNSRNGSTPKTVLTEVG